ncbi:hypothetical protein P167DRAFT_578467 [Morchella conica CCBAS932]|uniref:Uncharacterized protein n=1 Tax=Morchella conica CCBAS932 TaxID=1392247 RepID=A0A3N4KCK6_9PEZI|nr:hypothetical protein P167DRAFT_578467 [Morchella conica CCBAS932]
MSNIQALGAGSTTSFRELLRKFRQEQKGGSFIAWSWFNNSTEDLPSTCTANWWESTTDLQSEKAAQPTTATAWECGEAECDTCSTDEDDDAASTHSHWLGCYDGQEVQDNASFSSASHDEGYEYSDDDSDAVSVSSASSTYSEDYDELDFGWEKKQERKEEEYLPALGWWKVYRSGWWENSEGAVLSFEEDYVGYRFSALLPIISEEREESSWP